MHEVDLIMTLTGGLAAALVCGYATSRVGLSPIVGYLIAGFICGPNTPGFVANREIADQFAEVGVVLLMFGVGLQFHLNELLAVRRIVAPGAVLVVFVATLIGATIGMANGQGGASSIVFGLSISLASTVVLTRVLAENGDIHTPIGHIAIGWLVVEDILTVVILVLLPVVFGGASVGAAGIAIAVAVAVIKLVVLIASMFILGKRFIPWLLDRAAASKSRELFTLTVLVVALGVAVASAKLFGVSMALGAFLAGMVVGQSEFSLRAATDALPMRDAFAVLFFVSIGIVFDPKHLLESPGLLALTLALILVGKPLAIFLYMIARKQPMKSAIALAFALGQIGEFSFILVAAGKTLGLLNDSAANDVVAAAIVTITINPLLYKLIGAVLAKSRGAAHAGDSTKPSEQPDSQPYGTPEYDCAIVVGHGPAGRTLVRLLEENKIVPIVIELNLDSTRAIKARGTRAIYGDATRRETLEHAGIDRAVGLFLTSAAMTGAIETIRHARAINPDIFILARVNYLSEAASLRSAGADFVVSSEVEGALALTEVLLRRLGATADQIDRERDRVRTDLYNRGEGLIADDLPLDRSTNQGDEPNPGAIESASTATIESVDGEPRRPNA